ncbi:MAG: addiction module protein [Balneolaceae bacterium]
MINEKIKKGALNLSQKERAELAHLLIDSLGPGAKIKTEKEWSDELKSRIDKYEKGERSAKDWNRIKNNAKAILDR